MLTYYIDETGFTGEDLLAEDQPIFALSSNNFTAAEADNICREYFRDVNSRELKYSRLSRNPRHRERVIEMVRFLATDPLRNCTWVAHKEFALVTFVVDWWIEPLAHRTGQNLYKDGAILAMSNMLFMCLEGFWSRGFRRNFLLHFQRMFRARTQERFDECEKFIRKER